MKRAFILLVTDQEPILRDMQTRIASHGHELAGAAATAEDALRRVMERGVDLALVQIDLGGALEGIEAAAYISQVFNTPVLYLVGRPDDRLLALSKVTDPAGYLSLPCSSDELKGAIDRALAPDLIFAGKAKGPGATTTQPPAGHLYRDEIRYQETLPPLTRAGS
jgi:DNA-binding NarL/FixJ family response regulator